MHLQSEPIIQNWERNASVKTKQNFLNQIKISKPKFKEPVSTDEILKQLFGEELPQETKKIPDKHTENVSIILHVIWFEVLIFFSYL
jgi:hypothetical protein